MKKQLMYFGGVVTLLILFIAVTSRSSDSFLKEATGADCGPCSPSIACGNINDHGTCKKDELVPGCEGNCNWQCAGGVPDYYCDRISGSCTPDIGDCSQKYTGNCTMYVLSGGIGYVCKCDQGNPTGLYCIKTVC